MTRPRLIAARDLRSGMRLVETTTTRPRTDLVARVDKTPSGGIVAHLATHDDDTNTRRVCLCSDDHIFVTAEPA